MKTGILFAVVILSTLPGTSHAALTGDVIEIQQVYVSSTGEFAIEATAIIANASADRDCASGATWAKSWAGFGSTASDRMVSVILSAHAQNKRINISTNGCEGAWHKIVNVYIVP